MEAVLTSINARSYARADHSSPSCSLPQGRQVEHPPAAVRGSSALRLASSFQRCRISELLDFLRDSEYEEVAGAISPFGHFVKQFLDYLDDDQKILFWLQHRRIERALVKDGFPIGPAAALGARSDQLDQSYIGNLSGPRSRFVSMLPVVLDPDIQLLLPRDLSRSEMHKLRSPK